MRPHVCDVQKHERSLKMQGDGPWQDVWEPLIDFAEKQGLASVKINVNMAWLHQSYHATWRSVRLPEKAFQNVVRIPLFAARGTGESLEYVPIGRLEVITSSTEGALDRLRDFLDHAGELQEQVENVIARLEASDLESKMNRLSNRSERELVASQSTADSQALASVVESSEAAPAADRSS